LPLGVFGRASTKMISLLAPSACPPADLADRLGHRLRLSVGTRRSGGDRHRTLRSAIQWSYDLLTASERTVFGRLAVFTGPLSLAAAEHVASSADLDIVEVADVVDRLVDQAMLVHRGFWGWALLGSDDGPYCGPRDPCRVNAKSIPPVILGHFRLSTIGVGCQVVAAWPPIRTGSSADSGFRTSSTP
jgi:hypothetical protein